MVHSETISSQTSTYGKINLAQKEIFYVVSYL